MSNTTEEIKLKSSVIAIGDFAAELTTKARELQKLEDEWRITPIQSVSILDGMIQNFIWAVVNTLKRQDQVIDLAEQDRLAATILANPPNPSPQGNNEGGNDE